MCLPMRAHWHNLANMIELVLPSLHNQDGKSIGSANFAQLIAECHRAHLCHLANTIGHVHTGATWHILNLCFLWPTRVHNPNGKLIGLAVFAQLTAESLYTVFGATFRQNCPIPWGHLDLHLTHAFLVPSEPATQMAFRSQSALYFTIACPVPLKTTPSHGGLGPQSNTWFPGPTRVLNANSILVGSAVFDGPLVWQTDSPCYSVGNNRPHLCT